MKHQTIDWNAAATELHTLNDFVRLGTSLFNAAHLYFGHGTDNAIDDAITLVLHALYLEHEPPENFWSARLTLEEKHSILALFRERIEKRLPAAYLCGEAWFAGLRFRVNEQVLIPRSPLAELINAHFQPWLETEPLTQVLDLCTGSGCIAIATALTLPQVQVDATDISSGALKIAQQNVEDYDLQAQVEVIHSDLFDNLQGRRYDLILCNPPYVDAAEMANMPAEYQHEPELGLAAGIDGLDVVKRILRDAAQHLNEDGVLIVEVGASASALMETYPEVDFTWLDFAHGGSGVFLLTAAQLNTHQAGFE